MYFRISVFSINLDNQEDSVMINKSAIDRGLFTSTYYKSYRDQCNKNHSTGEEEIFAKPEQEPGTYARPYNYDKLGEDGFVPKNTYVDSNDILVGKVMPYKLQGTMHQRDTSLQMKGNDEGCVDMNYVGINGEAYKFCKVRLRKYRKPVVGDKCASRSAQKGTIGMIYHHQDMPFTKNGITPDIIMNPHAIPSRMTIGQLMECIMGKASCHLGAYGDATPFTDCTVEGIADILEKSGYERYGNEILYNGRTGEQINTEIFIGPTYYQRLKHMVADKCHCLTADHEVLTADGWKPIAEVSKTDKVATLQGKKLVYDHPTDVMEFPDYKGQMYHIKTQAVELDVTANHRMYISMCHPKKHVWSEYQFIEAQNMNGKAVRYKKNAEWTSPAFVFTFPSGEMVQNMDAWLTFFGIWMAEGNVQGHGLVCIRVSGDRSNEELYNALMKLCIGSSLCDNLVSINTPYLYEYLTNIDKQTLPEWVWDLSANQCQTLIDAMMVGDCTYRKPREGPQTYYTENSRLADDFQRLCLHAGWTTIKDTRNGVWKLTAVKNSTNPTVNHGPIHVQRKKEKEEYMYDYEGPVYCLQVPSEVFMVRKNGKCVWTGNSRGSNGPIIMLTRQPAEGRARNGGLRFGEMERDAMVAHGASSFLKERMLDVSDNFRVFVCRKCGILCTSNPEKGIFKCNNCKNSADITQVRIPYSMKLLMQELMTMGVAPRLMV